MYLLLATYCLSTITSKSLKNLLTKLHKCVYLINDIVQLSSPFDEIPKKSFSLHPSRYQGCYIYHLVGNLILKSMDNFVSLQKFCKQGFVG